MHRRKCKCCWRVLGLHFQIRRKKWAAENVGNDYIAIQQQAKVQVKA